jgi:hypothetical protein
MLALQLRFYRDIPFQLKLGPDQTTSIRSRLWSMMGSMDYLECLPLKSLSDVKGPSNDADPTLGGQTELLLVPNVSKLPLDAPRRAQELKADQKFAIRQSEKFATAAKLFKGELSRENEKPYRMAVLIRWTLSSIVIDGAAGYFGVNKRLNLAYTRLERAFSRFKFSQIWTTLGGPDLVAIIPISSQYELDDVYREIACTRRWSGAEIQVKAMAENHAFSMVQANLIYRDHDELLSELAADEKANRKRQHKTSFLCRVTVGPGHEEQFLADATANLKLHDHRKRQSTGCSWSYRSVILRLPTLPLMLCAIRNGLHEGGNLNSPRRSHVLSMRTSILFDAGFDNTQKALLQHSVISISPDLKKILTKHNDALVSFGSYLGEVQRNELTDLYVGLAGAFRRNDRAVAIRDLLPFFSQLSDCLSHPLWPHYFETNGVLDSLVNRELSALISHTWKAIRHRIEQRNVPADLSFPNTVEAFAANKLINASTVLCWLSWEILRDNSTSNRSSPRNCADNQFAACVTAGSSGRVYGQSIFANFWQFAKQNSHSAAKTEKPSSTNWNAPLVLFSIAGPVLLSPEIAFVHFAHDIAEFCNWLQQRGNSPIRGALYDWLSLSIRYSIQRTVEQYWRKRKTGYEIREKAKRQIDALFKVVALKAFGFSVDNINTENINSLYVTLITAFADIRFSEKTARSFFFERQNTLLLNHPAVLGANAAKEAEMPTPELTSVASLNLHTPTEAGEPNFTSWVPQHSAIAHEIFSDIGAWAALDFILVEKDERNPKQLRHAALSAWFQSLLSSTLDVYSAKTKELEAALIALGLRWAVQYAALDQCDDKWISEFSKEFRLSLQRASIAEPLCNNIEKNVFSSKFFLPNSEQCTKHKAVPLVIENGLLPAGELVPLALILREFAPYGGPREMKTGGFGANIKSHRPSRILSRSIREVLLENLRAPNYEAHNSGELDLHRIWLAFQLWAKAQKFFISRLFV